MSTIVVVVALSVLAMPAAGAYAQQTASAPTPSSGDEAIVQLRDRYLTAASVRDAAGAAALFAEDAVMVAPDGALVRGRQEIATYFADAFGRSDSPVRLTFICATTETRDGFGSETGRFEERVTGVTGTYVLIYRRDESGRWRIAIEIRSTASQDQLADQ